jgi:small-conductance mechanosensitive channel
VTEVPSVELRIAPLLKAQIPRLRGDIQEVECEMAAYRASVSSSGNTTTAAARAYTQWGAGAEAAEQELAQAEARHHTEWTSKLDKVISKLYFSYHEDQRLAAFNLRIKALLDAISGVKLLLMLLIY